MELFGTKMNEKECSRSVPKSNVPIDKNIEPINCYMFGSKIFVGSHLSDPVFGGPCSI